MTTSLQPSRAALPAKQRPAGQSREDCEGADVQARDDGHVGVARAPTPTFCEQHHRQLLRQRDAQQAVGLGVVAHALRAGEHGGVVGHDHGARALGAEALAIDRADAGHHAVGRRVGDQVFGAAAAALRRHGQRAVFDERTLVTQVGDVLARGAQAQRVAPGHRLRTRSVEQKAFAFAQPGQIGPLGGAGSRGLRCGGRWDRDGCRRPEDQQGVPLVHHIADGAQHLGHLPRGHGTKLVLHLHRLDDDQGVAGPHRVAHRHAQLDDLGLQRSAKGFHGGIVPPAPAAPGQARDMALSPRTVPRCRPRQSC